MRRRLYAISLIFAALSVIITTVCPHHHHTDQVCVGAEQCAHHNATQCSSCPPMACTGNAIETELSQKSDNTQPEIKSIYSWWGYCMPVAYMLQTACKPDAKPDIIYKGVKEPAKRRGPPMPAAI